jgi:FMN phosphatase YigB (HAD superfamily)
MPAAPIAVKASSRWSALPARRGWNPPPQDEPDVLRVVRQGLRQKPVQLLGGGRPAGAERAVEPDEHGTPSVVCYPSSVVRAVVLDVGETLVDETHGWGTWADWFGIPRLTFFAVLGQVIARGEHHRRVFDLLVPGVDLAAEQAAKDAAGMSGRHRVDDLYPDALPCLAVLRAAGLVVGLAGNQPAAAEEALREAGVVAEFVCSSERWGVEKPSSGFFRLVAEQAGRPPGDIAYVGDRVDNDVVPAADAGMHAVWLRRGPWAQAQAEHPGVSRASARIDGLGALPTVVSRL